MTRYRKALLAGIVAAALWMLVNGLNIALTFNSTLPSSLADIVFPAAIRSVTWVSDPPWNVVTPIVSALAVGALIVIGSRLTAGPGPGSESGSDRGTRRVPRTLTSWFTALLAAGLVGFALALGQTFHDWPPSRVWNAFDGFPDAIRSGVLWGVVWGWIPAVLFARVDGAGLSSRASARKRGGTSRMLVGAVAAVFVLAVVVSSSLTGYSVPAEPSDPAPIVQPTGPAVPLIAEGSPVVDPQWCSDDQLALEAGAVDGAAGHRSLQLLATNHTGVDCVLDGYPDLAFADANDFLLTLHLVHGGSFTSDDPGPAPIILSAGQSATARLGWDAQPRDPDHTVAYLHLAPYPGAERIALPIRGDLIQDADVAVTAWAGTARVAVPVDSGPRQAAEGDVTYDASGAPISYTVADGDKLGAIGDRFGLDVVELTHPDGSRYDYSNVIIQPGDVLGFAAWSPACRSSPTTC
ncbi:hypothetical protein B7R22_13420 [Subtercola boreus]|uniref:DUF4232 domain-containing protein n=1 Tax=Subtercola boreus TaxID=120213 RepID=A0A3E0VUX9_9MICO|nr:DUF4232 domain-containing protein [Subtercola boreus]RFA13646.1 hypothetical protein B7R22_13420 [Subtercola boreus]